LKENGVLLLYISADGHKPQSDPTNERLLEHYLFEQNLRSQYPIPYSLGGVRLNKGKKSSESESKVSTPISYRSDSNATTTNVTTSTPTSTNDNTNESVFSPFSARGNFSSFRFYSVVEIEYNMVYL
jgi:hypothetical protein